MSVLRLGVCGAVEVQVDGRPLADSLLGGRQGRLVLAYLLIARPNAVRREELADLLWDDRLPSSWSASLSAVISRLRRLFTEAGLDGSAVVASTPGGYELILPPGSVVDVDELAGAVAVAESAAASGEVDRALAAADTAEAIAAGGFLEDQAEWVDRQRARVRDLRVRALLARATAHLGADSPTRAADAARDAIALDDTREAAYRVLMRALVACGERAEALRVWERCRTALVEELGIDPSPETEALYLEVLGATPVASTTALPSGVVTFLLTDIVESSSLWDKAANAMARALERHDAIVAHAVTANAGTLLKSKLEGDATVSVFGRASNGVVAALALREAIASEDWPEEAAPRLRMAMHTGEAFERGGDYFGPALNRAARLRSLAGPGDLLLSQAVAELVRDHLPVGVALRDLGHRDLRGLSRGENVYALVRATPDGAPDTTGVVDDGTPVRPPALPPALVSEGPFVGRVDELAQLVARWGAATQGTAGAVFVGGEPGVGKSRLAAEVAAHAHAGGAIVLHGRCDEDLAAPLQPFVEALRTLVPALGPELTRAVAGIDELLRVVPELAEQLPDRAPAVRADPDTERLAMFDATVSVLVAASKAAPVLLVLDDLHWAGKTTLSLLRHLLRGAKAARLLVVGTYRDTELGRTHPLAETLADLRRDAGAARLSLAGLAPDDIDAYLVAVGIEDRALGRELAEVTSGNAFFLLEVLRHVEETGGMWSPGNLPEGVRDATGRRLSRLSDATNRALSVAAVVGTSFELALIERLEDADLVDEIAEACQAGLVVEEPGAVGRFRFAHALVRQVLLAELVTVKRLRLHRAIAELLETTPMTGDADVRLTDLAYHWSESASLGDGRKAVDACQRAADRAMGRLAYEEAADLYGMALQVVDVADDLDGDVHASLHLARCDALLTAGDVGGARAAIDALETAASRSERLAAWYTTYEGQLAVLAEPDRLTEIVRSIGAAADAMRALGDQRGEARAHFVHASALERLGQIGAAERALDAALAAARGADDRRLADSILAEAPPAALWGPSSVTRASGRCLDVVRVLRISSGAPAVEAVALRCQAVLEALRGRDEAARRMVASARRTVERLGLVHRQLETEVAAGYIELLSGDAAEAEALLRPAYEGLSERGLGGEAAQAAAFLGRALLLQDRVDEADAVAAEAEALAGSDLKAAIAWRDVRADAAARRGDATRALALAREAVDLAATTDALLLVADARLTLAAVLRATGDEPGADAEAARALEACEAKGATALIAQAGGRARGRPAAPSSAPAVSRSLENAAVEAVRRAHDAFNRGDFDAADATWSRAGQARWVDRRPLMAAEMPGGHGLPDQSGGAQAHERGARFEDLEPLVLRDDHAALVRVELRGPGSEWVYLVVVALDDAGYLTDYVLFDVADRREANVELDRVAGGSTSDDTTVWRTCRRFAMHANRRDWEAARPLIAPGYQQSDRRTGITAPAMNDPVDNLRLLFELDDCAVEYTLVETYGDRRALVRGLIWFRDGAVGDAEVANLTIVDVDDEGLISCETAFDVDALDDARAVLRSGTGVEPDTAAWRTAKRSADAANAHDWDALEATFALEYQLDDRRSGRAAFGERDAIDVFRTLFTLDDWTYDRAPIEVSGDRHVLCRDVIWFRDGEVADAEMVCLCLIEVDEAGRMVRNVTFDADDIEPAIRELREGDSTAWRAARRFAEAARAHDWDALVATLAPGYQHRDRRGVPGWVADNPDDPIHLYRTMFALDDWTHERTLVEQSGDSRVLVRDLVSFRDGAVAEAEVEALGVIEVDDSGLIALEIGFEPHDLDAALAELRAGGGAPEPNAAWRAMQEVGAAFNSRDWDRLLAATSPAFTLHDRRSISLHAEQRSHEALEYLHAGFELDEFRVSNRLIGTRGEGLALVAQEAIFRDGSTGLAEISVLSVVEADGDGRILRQVFYDANAIEAARAELDAALPNAVWQALQRQEAASDARDWDAFAATFDPGYEYVEHRRAMWQPPGTDHLAVYRTMFALDEWRLRRVLLDTRGDRLALTETHCWFRDGVAGPAHSSSVQVIEAGPDGLVVTESGFDLDEVATARGALEARWREMRSDAGLD